MIWLRKTLILTHRYLGIVLGVFFVVWFVSGIGIMYSKGMPRLTPELRLERLSPIDLTRVRLTPSEAAERAGSNRPPGRITLLTILDRPAYRLGGGRAVTVFADNGEVLKEVGQAEALRVAGQFMNISEDTLHYALQTEVDEWTLAQRRQMPLHRVTVDDASHTQLYISPQSGEVVVLTTRGSRALAWIAAIPHWLYFTKLRVHDKLWQQVVLWTSGIGSISALIGIILGFIQLRFSRPFRFSKISSYIPYAGWMRWHYITGFIFGILTLTWVFSGYLSMEPWEWFSEGGLGDDVRATFTGGPLDPGSYPSMDPAAWQQQLGGHSLKEVEFARIQGDSYYVVRGTEPGRLLIRANPLEIRREPFSVELLMSQVKEAYPDAPVLESRLLSGYDAYYRDQDAGAPLPVLRVKFGDPDQTWFYIDPAMSQLVGGFTWRSRIERWLYHGFHSLDFSFWYYNRTVWSTGIILLSLGGIAVSGLGLFLGIKRVLRFMKVAF